MVSYEDLAGANLGPLVTMTITQCLAETDGVEPIARESVPCVWETIVNYKNAAPSPDMVQNNNGVEEGRRKLLSAKSSSPRTGPQVPPHTKQNLADMLAMFHRLVEKYSYDEVLVRVLVLYIQVV